ncbi:hypothetical protein DYU05_19800 [Mucilaginibacter terrenus]|uniref:Uncharacterized protein n=1 Tax=Mucilaginibacter terrenus TaxID=2482727 RepID=A0A3E2NJR3_9SPHI|nr:hypothetical protein [Mucilaginibacter terrenus]RFZ81229.1 hypothetical protein DYU05_19800 [Mucilaginibacter terrenus]
MIKIDIWDKRVQAVFLISCVFLYLIVSNPRRFYASAFQSDAELNKVILQQLKMDGQVAEKFLDKRNHLYKVIILREKEELTEYSCEDPVPTELWDKISVGIYIKKKENSFVFYLSSKDCKDTVRATFDGVNN